MVAQHLIYFMDYTGAENQLRSILKDELAYYNLTEAEEAKEEVKAEDKEEEEEKEEEKVNEREVKKVFEKIDLSKIKVENTDPEKETMDYTSRTSPLFKLTQTLILLAECFAFRLQTDHAVEVYDFIDQKCYK
jgi:hypothetical protein